MQHAFIKEWHLDGNFDGIHLAGRIYDHPRLPDGYEAATSVIQDVCRKSKGSNIYYVRTENTLYTVNMNELSPYEQSLDVFDIDEDADNEDLKCFTRKNPEGRDFYLKIKAEVKRFEAQNSESGYIEEETGLPASLQKEGAQEPERFLDQYQLSYLNWNNADGSPF